MANDPNVWLEMQQQFQRFWQGLQQPGSNEIYQGTQDRDLGGLWSQFGLGSSPVGPEVFSQWLNKNLLEFLGAPLWSSPFAGNNSANPFVNSSWSPMAPSEFAPMKELPPIGLNRESELRWRELRDANAEQIKATSQLGRRLAGVYSTALKRFKQTLSDPSGDGEDITSLRELYDLWVSIAEQAYAEQVMTADYSKAFGNCINTSARAAKAWQELSDEVQQSINLPTRRELDSVIERQHALQATVRALGERLDNDKDLSALSDQIDTLSQRLDGLSQVASDKSRQAVSAKPKKSTPPSVVAQASSNIKSKRSRSPSQRRRKASAQPAHEFDIGGIVSGDGQR